MKLPKSLKGAIFDLDGTLLDSLHAWRDVDSRFFAKRGRPLPPTYSEEIKPFDLYGAAKYTKTAYGLSETAEELVEEWRTMIREEYALRVELKPKAKDALYLLKARGWKLGIATSGARDLFLPTLERYGVAELFDAIVETGEAGRGKQFPDVYLLCAEKLGIPPAACAVFEDILVGIRAAKAGGFYAVAVADPLSGEDDALLCREADLFLPSFAGLTVEDESA